MKGEDFIFHSDALTELTDNQMLVDVRTEAEVDEMGMIHGAINIPVDELRQNLSKLDKNKEILVYCQIGLRGHVASRLLLNLGYKVKNLTGGFKTWKLVTR